MKKIAYITPLLLCWMVVQSVWAADRLPELTVRDVGHYGICPWGSPDDPIKPGSASDRMRGLDFTIRNIFVRDEDGIKAMPEVARRTIQEINNGLAFNPPKTMILRVDFWNGEDRHKGELQPFEVYQHRMEVALKNLEPILDKIHGLSLSEENVPREGRTAVLEKMYRFVKSKYPNLRCYQWWTPNTAVPATYEGIYLSADGWIVDPYSLGPDLYPNGPTSRRFVQKYLVTGKPLVFIAPGWNFDRFFSPGKPNESFKNGFDGWKNIDDQLQVCLDYNVPVAWYWFYVEDDDYVSPNKKTWATFPMEYETELGNQMTRRILAWIEQAHALPKDYEGTEAAERWENPPLAVTVKNGQELVAQDFSSSNFLDQTTGTGFRDLVWNGHDLRVRGYRGRQARVRMDYQLSAKEPMQLGEVTLGATVDPKAGGKVVVLLSADGGKNWFARSQTRDNAGEQKLRVDAKPMKEAAQLVVRIEMSGRGGSEEQPVVKIDDLRIVGR